MSILDHKLDSSMESLNALFIHATEGIIISNKSGTIIKANPSSETMFGYKLGELAGKLIEDLIPSRFKDTHIKHRENFNEKPRARSMGSNMELFARRKDNSEFPVEISLSYYQKEDENYVIAFIIDISERYKHQENVKRLNLELEKKVDERTKVLHEALIELEYSKDQLSKALDAEKELNDMKSRFVTMASHEFRTPLSTILSSVSLVNKYNEGDEKITKHVHRIKSAVTNMTLILNDFLSAEKLQEGKVFVRKEWFDIEQLSNEVVNEIQGLLKVGQKVNHMHSGTNMVFCDKQIIRNILLNLISNSIKFSPEHKVIQVTCIVAEHILKIVVSDQGLGIPLEEQEHLFERFFRAKNVTNIQGTGLGLNIVAKYVETLEGTVDFKSELNAGTVFTITLPVQE